MSKFKIIWNGKGQGKVYLNGIDITDGCFSFEVSAEVGKSPIVYLGLSGDIEVEGEGEVTLTLPDDRIFTVKD